LGEDNILSSLEEEAQKTLALNPHFAQLLGLFQVSWSTFDLVTDWAICKFLQIPAEQAHLITAGMLFGRKARLLADLIGKSDHQEKAKILGAFNKLRGNNKRDVFAHSYIRTSKKTITFVERSTSGQYKTIEHTFTLEEFTNHVLGFVRTGREFHIALGVTPEDIQSFANASLSRERKSKTSP
jgi:hypothetical protein